MAKIEGNTVYFYHNDHLGAPMLMTDETGQTVWEGEFLPFGETFSITSTITNNLRFLGQYYDEETGLHYNYFRDYKPEIGRYVEADRLNLARVILLKQSSSNIISYSANRVYRFALIYPQVLNEYLYVGNSPVNFVDTYGLIWGKITNKALKEALKRIAKWITGKPFDFNPGHPKEMDDDNDDIPNFMDPDSEHCEFNCKPPGSEPPEPEELPGQEPPSPEEPC